MYGQIQPDGSVKPDFLNRLVWAVIYRGVPAHKLGGPASIGTPRPPVQPAQPPRCDFVFLVDANTGKYLNAFTECPGRL